jgi:CBS domain-containing protein
MTGNYDLILPLMIASIISSLLSRKLARYSMYLEPLHRRGLVQLRRSAGAAFEEFPVRSLIREDHELLKPSDGFQIVVQRFLAARRQRLFVVSEAGRLLGEVPLHDIKHLLDEPSLPGILVHDLMQPALLVVHDTDALSRATEIFAGSDHERIPVLDAGNTFLGFLAKRDVLSMYAREMAGQQELQTMFVSGSGRDGGNEQIQLPRDYVVRSITLPLFLAGRTLAEADLPKRFGIRVVDIRRPAPTDENSDDVEMVIPNAASVLRTGDRLIVLGLKRQVEEFAAARGGSV